jgi:translation initiation factor IF-2
MSKIRVYELAKELGMENKVIIAKAMELGIAQKASHSSSLDSHEADQIRRSLLRQAITVNQIDSEVVTRRVDKVTGESTAVVEKRSGNVIRRRKASDDEVTEKPITRAEVVETQSSQESLSEAPQATLASAPEPEIHHVEEETEQQQVEVEQIDEQTEQEEQVQSASDEELEATETVEEASATAPEVDDSKKAGPKVLGRIALPVQKKPAAANNKSSESSRGSTARGAPVGVFARTVVEDDESDKKKLGGKKTKKREISRTDLLDYEGKDFRRGPKSSSGKTQKERDKASNGEAARPVQVAKRVIEMRESITVGDLAHQMSLKAGEVISKLIELGIMATINHSIDFTTASLIAEELGYEVKNVSFDEAVILQDDSSEDPESLKERPPVVTIMGHVDHGKTSLIDYIRKTAVAAKEAGGITQHIGAYSVTVNNKPITFLDTPGHAAFTAMRARGANVTDIVIIVCAADDGVMPQTVEAINHAKAANVPIIVAVNKIDKPEANVDRVKQQLTEKGLQPEDWGGDTMYCPVSALKGTGVKELLEGILLVAEVADLKANPDARASGTIIEAKQEKGRGAVATVLIQKGTLRVGDIFVCGAQFGRVRSMDDHAGKRIAQAGPSTPVEITGLEGVPGAGDDFFVVESDAKARQVASNRAEKKAAEDRALATGPISLEEFAKRANNITLAELNVIVKADVDGSVEAVKSSIEKLSTEKVKVRVLHAAVGGVTESDIQLAIASQALIVAFGVRAEPRAAAEAERASIEIRFYRIIYELLDDIRNAMAGLLPPDKKEVALGRVEVRDTFNVPKAGTVAGCYVLDGMVKRGAFVRLVRDSRVIHEGKMSSLRRFKDDVKEVNSGYECGIGLESYNDVKPGDVFEVFEVKEVAATLD